jgi:hypothetical protein
MCGGRRRRCNLGDDVHKAAESRTRQMQVFGGAPITTYCS